MKIKVLTLLICFSLVEYSCNSIYQFGNVYVEIYYSDMVSVYSQKWLLINVTEEKSHNLELAGDEIQDSLIFMFSTDLIQWGTTDSIYEKRRLLLNRETSFYIDSVGLWKDSINDSFFDFRMYNEDSIISELDFLIYPLIVKDSVFICKINEITFIFKSFGDAQFIDTVLPFLPLRYQDRGTSRLGRMRITRDTTREMSRASRRRVKEEVKEYKLINKEWNEKIKATNKMTQTKRYMLDSVFKKNMIQD